jgi:hypothetical protein
LDKVIKYHQKVDLSRPKLIAAYFGLGKQLPEKYSQFPFQNHCYWRIALDNALDKRWDTIVSRPAYRNLTIQQLKMVVNLLEKYEMDKRLLLQHNRRSLGFRKSKNQHIPPDHV